MADGVAWEDPCRRKGDAVLPSCSWLSAALVLLAGCVVGVFADAGATLAAPWSALAEAGTPFILVAFAAGRFSSRLTLSALAGAVALSFAQGAYYAWLMLGHDVAWGTVTYQYRASAWLAAGAVVGAVAGALGGASRAMRSRPVRALAWGLLVAVPLAEGVRLARAAGSHTGAGMILVATAAAIWAWAIVRDRAPWPSGVVSVVALIPAVLVVENFRQFV